MAEIELDYRVLGEVGTNCYLLCNKQTKECILIDAADEPERIFGMISESGCKLAAVLLTHGHYDHILAAAAVREKYGVKIYASCDEKELLASEHMNLSDVSGDHVTIEADVWHKDGECLKLAGIDIKVIHTPGHTKGGSCYYVSGISSLFSGDTLFAGSVGRTDFPTGSMSEIVRSIKEKLIVLPDDTKVFPGHGESSSIRYEKQYNPYLG
jgi:glyoxylase-like metal-dependent hydrolase (beta-lactamase superfamily II)